ncbi:MAG: YbaK/EbsC family protein [Pseudonocardiaceae bacterium]
MSEDMHAKLIALLDEAGARYRVIRHEPEGRTDLVSELRGNQLGQAAKCIVVRVKQGKKISRYVLAVVLGDRRLDQDAVRHLVEGTYCSFVQPGIAERLTGCASGTIVPFSFDPELRLVVDPIMLSHEEMFFNAAALDRSIALRTEDYVTVAKPEMLTIVVDDDPSTVPHVRPSRG